jgi:biotin transporter BioY
MMEKEQIGIIVFVLMALLSAILFHSKWDSFWISSVLAVVFASLLFQVVGYFILGYLDPFFLNKFCHARSRPHNSVVMPQES